MIIFCLLLKKLRIKNILCFALIIFLSYKVAPVLLLGAGGVLVDPVDHPLLQPPLLQLGAIDHGEGGSYHHTASQHQHQGHCSTHGYMVTSMVSQVLQTLGLLM